MDNLLPIQGVSTQARPAIGRERGAACSEEAGDHLGASRIWPLRCAARLAVLALLCLVTLKAGGQSIFTYAGGGTDDGRPATQAAFVPEAIAVDRSGNFFVADKANLRVLRVDGKTGITALVAGTGENGFSGEGGPATAATFSPNGIAVDGAGNLYVGDYEHKRVLRVDAATGVMKVIAGNGRAGPSGDQGPATQAGVDPYGIALDSSGNLFIADELSVRRVDAVTGIITKIAGNGTREFTGGGPATSTGLVPYGVATSLVGDVYVPDGENNRVLRVDLKTGLITSVAGSGAAFPHGDGGPATRAGMRPRSAGLDRLGNLFIADVNRVRRVDAITGVITTFAGNGASWASGDGGPATAAGLDPFCLAVDGTASVLIGEPFNARVRRIDTSSGIISTVAGTGSPHSSGDGGPATAAGTNPWALTVDRRGNLLIAEYFYGGRVRKVDASSGTITTVAGKGDLGSSGDGGAATEAGLAPASVAVDDDGNLFIADAWNNHFVRRVDAQTGTISTIAGNGFQDFSGDGGPATDASILPLGVALDRSGGLLIADGNFLSHNRIRRVDLESGLINTVAGNGNPKFSGDGGPATAAGMAPAGVAVDTSGNMFIVDNAEGINRRIRRVDARTNVVTTVAGNGDSYSSGDGGLATKAGMNPVAIALDTSGNLFIADGYPNGRIRRVDEKSGMIETVAGVGTLGFSGDGGPATAAGLLPNGVAVDSAGNLFVADDTPRRVRVVRPCMSIEIPVLVGPTNGEGNIAGSARLAWNLVPGAFSHDVYLGNDSADLSLVATGVTGGSFLATNLASGTRYSWRVVAKGDPYCTPKSVTSSETWSFTTATGCAAPASAGLTLPADNATGQATTLTLTWAAVTGARNYDVYLGTTNPPPLVVSGVTGTSYTPSGLQPGSLYYWNVVTKASCDTTKISTSPVRTFETAGTCAAPGSFTLAFPPSEANDVPAGVTLSWNASANAGGYDVHFGTELDPPLFLSNVPPGTRTLTPGSLRPGVTYRWKVVARPSCVTGTPASSDVRSFRVAGICTPPRVPVMTFVPEEAGKGQSYVVAWKEAEGLDAGGGYIVERSLNATFSPILDRQVTSDTFASFVGNEVGRIYHRVFAAAGCDPTKLSLDSDPRRVTITEAKANVVFTVQPKPVFTALGDDFENILTDKKTSFVLQNIGGESLTLSLQKQRLENASDEDFFYFRDPMGGSVLNFTLGSGETRSFEVRFQGVQKDKAASYQGVIQVMKADGSSVPGITPYAFVNLKIGSRDTTAPELWLNGERTEAVFFPGFDGDDSRRAPITVDVHNPGSTPMELGAEIGPELWLEPEFGWNATPIQPGATRTIKLYTKRVRAPNGTALPRYTYFTVRTKSGASARLLVQDNEASKFGAGRPQLDRNVPSHIVPSAASAQSKIGNLFISRLKLSNTGTEAVQTEIYLTAPDKDGYETFKKAIVVVPPNDLVNLTDPLIQVFDLERPAVGTLEVRVPREKAGYLTVASGVDAPSKSGGTFGFQMPVVRRGIGARAGIPYEIAGITATGDYRTNLILSETTGIEATETRVTLYDKTGTKLGETTLTIPRYGMSQLNGVVPSLGGGNTQEAASLEIEVLSGGGAVFGAVTVIDNRNDDAVTYVAIPSTPGTAGVLRNLVKKPAWARAIGTQKVLVPSIVTGYSQFLPGTSTPYMFRSLMGFKAPASQAATFELKYYDLGKDPNAPELRTKTVEVPRRQTVEYKNVIEELFGLAPGQGSQGPVFVEVGGGGSLYTKVYSTVEGRGSFGDAFPVIPIGPEGMTGGASQRPLEIDDLEQAFVETGPGEWSERSRGTRSNLILNEALGKAVRIRVSLYEAGNRLVPIAEREFDVKPLERLQLNTVFAALGLSDDAHRKDRKNVKCIVQAVSGEGMVSAVVTTIDNQTADIRNGKLVPAGTGEGTGPIGF